MEVGTSLRFLRGPEQMNGMWHWSLFLALMGMSIVKTSYMQSRLVARKYQPDRETAQRSLKTDTDKWIKYLYPRKIQWTLYSPVASRSNLPVVTTGGTRWFSVSVELPASFPLCPSDFRLTKMMHWESWKANLHEMYVGAHGEQSPKGFASRPPNAVLVY